MFSNTALCGFFSLGDSEDNLHFLRKVSVADCCDVGIRAVRDRRKTSEKHTKIEVFILGGRRNTQRVSAMLANKARSQEALFQVSISERLLGELSRIPQTFR